MFDKVLRSERCILFLPTAGRFKWAFVASDPYQVKENRRRQAIDCTTAVCFHTNKSRNWWRYSRVTFGAVFVIARQEGGQGRGGAASERTSRGVHRALEDEGQQDQQREMKKQATMRDINQVRSLCSADGNLRLGLPGCCLDSPSTCRGMPPTCTVYPGFSGWCSVEARRRWCTARHVRSRTSPASVPPSIGLDRCP